MRQGAETSASREVSALELPRVSPEVEILGEGFAEGMIARKRKSQWVIPIGKRPRTHLVSQKEQESSKSEQSLGQFLANPTKEKVVATSHQETPLPHTEKGIPKQSQVPNSGVPTSQSLSLEVPIKTSRPRHNVKMKNLLGSRKETLLIRRNLSLLKKNTWLEHQLKICKQNLEYLQSSNLHILFDDVFEIDKENFKPQTFMCSECKSIFRDVGYFNDLQIGKEKPLSSPIREISPESSPQPGATQEPPCQNEEKPQELSSSPKTEPQEPFPNFEAGVTQEPPEPQPMVAPLPTHQE